MDSVVHFEIPADDMKRAQKFYSKVFGWKANEMPEMQYAIFETSELAEDRMPKERGRINGGLAKRGMNPGLQHPVITIEVDDIEKSLAAIEKQGGKKLVGKMPVGDMGFSAYFKDPEGNIVGLWQLAEKT